MSLTKDMEVLRGIPLFAKIEPAKLKLLAFTSERLSFMQGDEICREGDTGDAAFIILEGEADISVRTPNGPMIVATLGKNDIIGEIAVLCDVPRTATVTAKTDLESLRVAKDNFFQLVTQFPQIGIQVMHELAERLHQTTQDLTQARAKLETMDG
ncbi:MAG: cyclic nucleotide-binding domain-containing protein [Alphaproteobacteria bacterium]|nr:cyclic nucleotide-binding domain-containing protein [Alphaproteobacteria bacterium]